MSTTWIRVAYGVVLGLTLLITTAFGAAMAQAGPKAPEPEISFKQYTGADDERGQTQLNEALDKFFAEARDYRDDYVDWQRNTALIAVGVAALLALIGLVLPAAVNYLRWGFLLGAAFVLVWAGAVALANVPNPQPEGGSLLGFFSAGGPKQIDFTGRFLRFAIGFVGLIILLFVGLWRLTEWPTRRPALVTTGPAVPAGAAVATAPVVGAWAPPPATEPAPVREAPPPPEESMPHRAETTVITPPPEVTPWQRPGEEGPTPRPDPSI